MVSGTCSRLPSGRHVRMLSSSSSVGEHGTQPTRSRRTSAASHHPRGVRLHGSGTLREAPPHPEWMHLRQTEPIWWCANEPGVDGYDDDGYWVVTKHADVKEISRRTNEVFSTWENTAIPRFAPGTEREIVEMTRFLFINQD